jgi:spermidine synthase
VSDADASAPVPALVLYCVTLTVASCSILYELLVAQALSELLGDTVLRYSVTLGCYLGALGLGAMLCGRRGDPRRRLVRVEVVLSLVGGLSVVALYALDALQRYLYVAETSPLEGSALAPWLFLGVSHALIVAIGVLSGFELPLLLACGERRRAGRRNLVLGLDYLGGVVGAVAFPLVLLPTVGVLAGGFVVGLLNAAACGVLLASRRGVRPLRPLGALAAAVLVLAVGLGHAQAIERHFLGKFYGTFDYADTSWVDVFVAASDTPVERHRSPYQAIDVVRRLHPDQELFNMVSRKHDEAPDYPLDVRLYLNRDYQFYSGMDEIYHEWFVHAPIQVAGTVPRQVLVLGGGDGLVLRELVSYPQIERIVHVELDPVMLALARRHPLLLAMNGGADGDPRVHTVQDDAFRWLRSGTATFDAVYVDMPLARNYALSKVYSREFYAMVRQRLRSGGFLAMDAPGAYCEGDAQTWLVYFNTLRAAGFPQVEKLVSRISMRSQRLQSAFGCIAAADADGGEEGEGLDEAVIRDVIARGVLQATQHFVLAFREPRSLELTWHDFGVPLYAFGPAHLPLIFDDRCVGIVDSRLVNSIFRPTLPRLAAAVVQLP